jgi:hypothetical protein
MNPIDDNNLPENKGQAISSATVTQADLDLAKKIIA